ncbi:MAG: hypothetical protein AAFO82_10625 [Bacteroidota bacterium]
MENRNILDHLDWEDQPLPKLYSKELIMTFTLFFSILLGVILYLYNLQKLGKWRSGILVTIAAVLYHWLTLKSPDFFPLPFFTQIFFNLVASLFLVGPIWNWQIGRELDYQIKSPMLPLFLAILFAAFSLYFKGITESLWNIF